MSQELKQMLHRNTLMLIGARELQFKQQRMDIIREGDLIFQRDGDSHVIISWRGNQVYRSRDGHFVYGSDWTEAYLKLSNELAGDVDADTAQLFQTAAENPMNHYSTTTWEDKVITPLMAWEQYRNILQVLNNTVHVDNLFAPGWMSQVMGCQPATLHRSLKRRMQNDLLQSRVCLWDTDIWSTAIRGSEDLAGCKVEIEQPVNHFWMFSRGSLHCELGLVFGMLVQTMEFCGVVGLHCASIIMPIDTTTGEWMTEDKLPVIQWSPVLQAGETLKDGNDCLMYAAYKFLQLPFVATEETKTISRQVRRQMERKQQHVPLLDVVTFRRRQEMQKDVVSTERKYDSCCWMVEGHWRKQWYAKSQAHKPKYIEPYIKGDTDKPFKAKIGTIHKVSR